MVETHWPCLELTHTTGWEERDAEGELLPDYEALVAWAEKEGVVDAEAAGRLGAAGRAEPARADATVARARELRALLHRIFSAVGSGGAPSSADIEALNGALPEANASLRLMATDGGWAWGWPPEAADDPASVLHLLVRNAAELLTSPTLDRVRLCDADDCGWLFVDGSRNRSRRWCDMGDCGNRAKARRYRERKREES